MKEGPINMILGLIRICLCIRYLKNLLTEIEPNYVEGRRWAKKCLNFGTDRDPGCFCSF